LIECASNSPVMQGTEDCILSVGDHPVYPSICESPLPSRTQAEKQRLHRHDSLHAVRKGMFWHAQSESRGEQGECALHACCKGPHRCGAQYHACALSTESILHERGSSAISHMIFVCGSADAACAGQAEGCGRRREQADPVGAPARPRVHCQPIEHCCVSFSLKTLTHIVLCPALVSGYSALHLCRVAA
jgi:hypothetical protein